MGRNGVWVDFRVDAAWGGSTCVWAVMFLEAVGHRDAGRWGYE